jgi:hypothetical protein
VAASQSSSVATGARRAGGSSGPQEPEIAGASGIIDTYISADSLKAAICAAGSACRWVRLDAKSERFTSNLLFFCRAVDIVMVGTNVNTFCCMR